MLRSFVFIDVNMPPIRRSQRHQISLGEVEDAGEGRESRPYRPSLPNKRSLEVFSNEQAPIMRAGKGKRSKLKTKTVKKSVPKPILNNHVKLSLFYLISYIIY